MQNVTVIIPTYNRSVYLAQTLRSVLNQTYPYFEVVVIDDGSSDNTAEVVNNFSDGRLHYLYQSNSGRSSARNRGIAAAKGNYLAFLDDDDLYLPHKLACQVAFLETNPNVALVASGTQLLDQYGSVRGVWRTWLDQPDLTLLNCLYACPLPTCSVLFRRQALLGLDHWFDPELDLAEDTDFFIRLLLAGCHMAWLPEIVSAYRLHPANSQRDGMLYSGAYRKLLDKLFAYPNIPPEVQAKRTQLFAHYHAVGACRGYATGQIEWAQKDLLEALKFQPALADGLLPPIVAMISSFAKSPHVTDSAAYVNFVFDNLPPGALDLSTYRHEARASIYMQRVFDAHKAGERPALWDLVRGACHAPRWLSNRGIWSILLREILGFSLSPSRRY
ncbi:MAG: hypothetical protein FOGNACKC_01323 [Anaerolineae bacterium]|nr:hypothetical protein [Anaerolineae bacterium]